MSRSLWEICGDAEVKAQAFVARADSDETAVLRAVAVTGVVCTVVILVAVAVGFAAAQPIRILIEAFGH